MTNLVLYDSGSGRRSNTSCGRSGARFGNGSASGSGLVYPVNSNKSVFHNLESEYIL
jgi:hypothetical protein